MEPRRYEALADELARQIATNVLRPGDRLPSIRDICRTRRLSAATVFRAYDLLETRGLIRAIPRSGYFVNTRARAEAPEPAISTPPEGAHSVDINSLAFDILSAVKSRDIVPLGSAFPSPLLFPLGALRMALSASARRSDAWSSLDDLPPGNERLRRQISKRYLARGVDVSFDEIVLTNGALEALNLCLEAMTRPGDSVLVESPSFYCALQSLQRLGLKAIELPTHPRLGVDLAGLADVLKTQRPAACWLMVNFQNPLGCSLPEEKTQALVELLSQHQIPLIEDGVYDELHHGSAAPWPAKAFDRRGLVMHCSSFSKTLAPGYRVGWAAAGRFADSVRRLKLMTTLSGSAPAQGAVAEYLQGGGYDRHLRRLRQALKTQKEALVEAITRHFPPDIRLTRPEGGYFLWVDMPWDAVDVLTLHRQALSEKISIAPGPLFSNHGEFRNCMRLNFGHPWSAEMDKAVATLARLTGQQPTRSNASPSR